MREIECAICGTKVARARHNQRYCSSRCRSEKRIRLVAEQVEDRAQELFSKLLKQAEALNVYDPEFVAFAFASICAEYSRKEIEYAASCLDDLVNK